MLLEYNPLSSPLPVSGIEKVLQSIDKATAPTSLQTERVGPCDALLRAKAFLPKMKEENLKLQVRLASGLAQTEVDIEVVDEDKPHIEMNIFPGILEQVDISPPLKLPGAPDAKVKKPMISELT